MDFPIHIDTISMGLPILYLKGSKVEISKIWCISVAEGCFNPSKQWVFTAREPIKGFFRIQRINLI